MSKGPNELINEAEVLMNSLSIDSTTRYNRAVQLFVKAGQSYKDSHNHVRAGEAYRKAADCYFHINAVYDAAASAAESARNFVQDNEKQEEARQSLDIAVKSFVQIEKQEEAARLLIEFSKLFKNTQLKIAVQCLRDAADIYATISREYDYTKLNKEAGELYVDAELYAEAAAHFEKFAARVSQIGTMADAADLCIKAVICQMFGASPASGRLCSDRLGKNVRGWVDQPEFAMTKDLIDAGVTRMEAKIRRATEAMLTKRSCDACLTKLLTIFPEKLKYRPAPKRTSV